jgi:hypothetical protein
MLVYFAEMSTFYICCSSTRINLTAECKWLGPGSLQARMRKVEHQASHTVHRYSLTFWAATEYRELDLEDCYAPSKLGSNVQSDFARKSMLQVCTSVRLSGETVDHCLTVEQQEAIENNEWSTDCVEGFSSPSWHRTRVPQYAPWADQQ